jgi:poly-gamma-glutamate capsule biosynthesis protein CapA/YwtB (metallophosphatase superfamily)
MTASAPVHARLGDAAALLKHVTAEEIPSTGDILGGEQAEAHLAALGEAPFDLVAVGDIMLGGRSCKTLRRNGDDYPLAAVLPLLRRSAICMGNLEGPLASGRKHQGQRSYAYRVRPDLAGALARAGINVVTLANNHLVDCGRAGVLETRDALRAAGVAAIGAGVDRAEAHVPVVLPAGRHRIGLLGYYWNRRTAATDTLAGSALDPPEALERDIGALRERVDRVVVTFHWGIPYDREPSAESRAKARLAIDLGAHAVIGHHPHVIQAFEIHRGRPIFYSVGNFAFGSGNSRAEGLAVAFRFLETCTVVDVLPLYVKNRDPRVDYQPKLLRGDAAARLLARLAELSGADGSRLDARGRLWLR